MKKLKRPFLFPLATLVAIFFSNFIAYGSVGYFPLMGDENNRVLSEQKAYANAVNIRNQELQNQMMEQQLTQERQAAESDGTRDQLILLYSQNRHPVYLGCLNCADNSVYSTNNLNSQFGSKHGKYSIYNRHSIYGSSHSNYSPCNLHALYPPVVVNKTAGIKYGLLTLNTGLYGAITNSDILYNLKNNVCMK